MKDNEIIIAELLSRELRNQRVFADTMGARALESFGYQLVDLFHALDPSFDYDQFIETATLTNHASSQF